MYGLTVGGDLSEFYDLLKRKAEYVYGATPWDDQLPYPGVKEFPASDQKEFGREPAYHAASGFAGCLIYAEAVKRAGRLEADRVREVLRKLEMRTMFGDFKVDETGFQTAHEMVMLQWQDGKKMTVWPDDLAVAKARFPMPPWQVIVPGILAGALHALVALGLGLIYGVMRVINIAHGPLLMLGAYTTLFVWRASGIDPYPTLPLAMVALFGVGVLLQRTLLFRVVDAPELSSLLLTFGLSIAIVNLAQLAFTSDLRAVEYITGSLTVGPLALAKSRLMAFAFASAITAAAFLFLQRTRLGKAIRATAQRREASSSTT
jgi:hypothetical protein